MRETAKRSRTADPVVVWGSYPWAKAGVRRKLAGLVLCLPARTAVDILERYPVDLYRPGAVLFYRSHLPLACHLVRHGSVALEFGHGSRAARGIVIEGPALLGHWHTANRRAYPVTARAITSVVAVSIPHPDLPKLDQAVRGGTPLQAR